MARTARSAISRLSGWMTSVTSVAVPPVDRLAVERRYTTCPSPGTESARQADALEHLPRLCIELQARQHLLVADAAARILVDDLDELRDGVLAVADDMARRAPGRGDQFAIDDQQAMIVALEESLDDDRARMLARDREALRDFFVGGEADRDAAAMVAVVGFGHDREADAAARRARPALPLCTSSCFGTGRPSVARILLVSSLSLASSTAMCGVRPVTVAWMRCWYLPWPSCTSDWSFRRSQGMPRLSAALTSAAVDGPSARRCAKRMNSSRASGQFQPCGHGVRRPDAPAAAASRAGAGRVRRRRCLHRAAHTRRPPYRRPARAGAARLAEGDFLARDVLQLDGDVLEHVAQPGAFVLAHAAEEAAGFAVRAAVLGQARQRGGQRIDEGGAQSAGRPLLRGRRDRVRAE